MPTSAHRIDILGVSTAANTAINRLLYRELAAAGWNVELALPRQLRQKGFSRQADPDQPGDVPAHHLDLRRDGSPRTWQMDGLIRLCEEKRPRIVFVENDPGSLMSLELGAWAKARGARIAVLSCENFARDPLADLRAGKRRRALNSAVISGAWQVARHVLDGVFTMNVDGTRLLRDAGFREVVQVPWGYDRRLFFVDEGRRRRTREKLGLTQPTIAYFGRVIPVKGVHHLVTALSRLQDIPWQFLIDHFAEYQDPYQQQIQQQLRDSGVAARTVSFDARHEEMPDYMNAADIVAVPSLLTEKFKEQYGRVAPESMACGAAVVVSDSGALPDLVGDTGLVIPNDDPDALTEALRTLLTDADRRQELGRRAAARAAAHLTLQTQVQMMDAVFRRWLRV